MLQLTGFVCCIYCRTQQITTGADLVNVVCSWVIRQVRQLSSTKTLGDGWWSPDWCARSTGIRQNSTDMCGHAKFSQDTEIFRKIAVLKKFRDLKMLKSWRSIENYLEKSLLLVKLLVLLTKEWISKELSHLLARPMFRTYWCLFECN